MVKTEERYDVCYPTFYMAERVGFLSARNDITGERFGYLTVIEMLWGYNGGRHTYTRCVCDCGNEIVKGVSKLRRNKTPSCGCMITRPYKATDETGQKFNRLTILEIIRGNGPAKAKCKCDCGNVITTLKASVTTGGTKSCGCYQKEKAIAYNLKDYSGIVSSHGIEILYPIETTKKGARPWVCKCKVCGDTFAAIPNQILRGRRASCGCLKRSSKEKMIDIHLQSLGVNFAQQVAIQECVNENVLRFDFGIYDSNNRLTHLIEYDGGQHFFPVKLWGGEESFNKIKLRDEIKNKYCEEHNIPLLRLPYTLTDDEIKDKITNIINP